MVVRGSGSQISSIPSGNLFLGKTKLSWEDSALLGLHQTPPEGALVFSLRGLPAAPGQPFKRVASRKRWNLWLVNQQKEVKGSSVPPGQTQAPVSPNKHSMCKYPEVPSSQVGTQTTDSTLDLVQSKFLFICPVDTASME